jgi:hypothetical protein
MTDTSISKSGQVKFWLGTVNGKLVLMKTILQSTSFLDGAEFVEFKSSVELKLNLGQKLPKNLMDSPYQGDIFFPYIYLISSGRIWVWKIVHEGFSFEPIKSENVVFLREIGQLVRNRLPSGISHWSGLKMINDQRGVRLDVSHKLGPHGGIIKKKTLLVSLSPETSWIDGKYKTTLDRSGIRIEDE